MDPLIDRSRASVVSKDPRVACIVLGWIEPVNPVDLPSGSDRTHFLREVTCPKAISDDELLRKKLDSTKLQNLLKSIDQDHLYDMRGYEDIFFQRI